MNYIANKFRKTFIWLFFIHLFFFLTTSFNLFAKDKFENTPSQQDEFYQMIEDMRKRHQKMLKSLLGNDRDFGSVFKEMEEMMNSSGFNDPFFNDNSSVVGEYDWLEDESSRTLKLKVTQVKDKPLEIKIEKKVLKIKGNVESVNESPSGKKKSIVFFERTFSIPEDVDSENPLFETKEGVFLVKFPKIKNKSKAKKSSDSINNKSIDDVRSPVPPSESDVSI